MLNAKNMGNSSQLMKPASSGDRTLYLVSGGGRRFQVPQDDHFFVTIREGSKHEFVRVESVDNDKLTVSRAQGGTTAQSFNGGACVIEEWCPPQLKEFIEMHSQGLDNTGVQAGTYCLQCATCIDVDSSGRITAVDEPKGCD